MDPSYDLVKPSHGLMEALTQGVRQPEPPLELMRPLPSEPWTPGTANTGVHVVVVDAGSEHPAGTANTGVVTRPAGNM